MSGDEGLQATHKVDMRATRMKQQQEWLTGDVVVERAPLSAGMVGQNERRSRIAEFEPVIGKKTGWHLVACQGGCVTGQVRIG